MRITLRQLEVFLAIARTESTTRASKELALSQSAVSAALHELELQLNAQLFERIGKRLLLNENARLLFPRAQSMLDQAQELEMLFSRGKSRLAIGASTTIGNYLLPPVISRYHCTYPETNLTLKIGNTAEIVSAVASLEVDAGFIEGPCHCSDLEVMPWCKDELVMVVGNTHPLAKHTLITTTDIAHGAWILRETGSGSREVMDQLLLPHLGSLNLVMEMGNSEAIRSTLLHGNHISCLPLSVVNGELERGQLHRLSHPPFFRQLYIIRHQQKHLSAGLQTFLALSLLTSDAHDSTGQGQIAP
jgi:Transcriptional regulator